MSIPLPGEFADNRCRSVGLRAATLVRSFAVPTTTAEPAAPPDASNVDPTCARLIELLRSDLGDRLLAVEVQGREICVRVERSAWVDALRSARRTLGMDYFCFLGGLDWLDSPTQTTRYENVWGSVDEEPAGDDAEATAADGNAVEPVVSTPEPVVGFVTGLAGGKSRFQVFARVSSTESHRGLTIKADLEEAEPRVATVSKIYAGADWHERETWEMYGFWFDGHQNLMHLYLPGAFEGYPLRKDFPLLAREVKPWPGLTNVEPISGEEETPEGAEA